MVEKRIFEKIIKVLDNVIETGPEWKSDKESHHFLKRKRRGHIPEDWVLQDYNNLIVNMIKELDNETFLYYKDTFDQRYFVIGNREWIVIVGENGILETAFPPDDYVKYLTLDNGFSYLGTIKEVRSYEL